MATKTAAEWLAKAHAEYLGGGLWRIDLLDELATTIDVAGDESTPKDDVRASALPALQALLGESETDPTAPAGS